LQSEFVVHQPSWPEPLAVAGAHFIPMFQSQISPPQADPVLQSMSFMHDSPVACAKRGAPSARTMKPNPETQFRIVFIGPLVP